MEVAGQMPARICGALGVVLGAAPFPPGQLLQGTIISLGECATGQDYCRTVTSLTFNVAKGGTGVAAVGDDFVPLAMAQNLEDSGFTQRWRLTGYASVLKLTALM
jgi:hypothetical protein